MKIIELNENYKDKLNEYLNLNENSSIFHTLEWKEIIEKTYNYEANYYIALENEKIVGYFPSFYINTILGKKITSNPFSFIASPLFDNNEIEMKMIEKIIEIGKKKKVKFIELKSIYPFDEKNIKHFNLITKKTSVIPVLKLDNYENIFKKFKKIHRRDIRRYRKRINNLNISIHELKSLDELKIFYNILLDECKNNYKNLLHPFFFFFNLYKQFNSKTFLIKDKKKKILAGLLCFFYKDISYAVFICGKHSKLNPATILYDEIIRWSSENNYKQIDLGLTFLSNQSLINFKKKWLAENKDIFIYYHLIDKKYKIKIIDYYNSYKLIRSIYKYTPTFLVKPFLRFITKQFG